MKYCKKCGSKLNINDLFCKECGLRLEKKLTIKKVNINLIFIFLGIILFFIGCGIIGTKLNDNVGCIIMIIGIMIIIFGPLFVLAIKYSKKNVANESMINNNSIICDQLSCPKCNSNNISFQLTSNTYSIKKSKGCLYWLLIGWWLEIILWLFLTLPRLLIFIFVPKRKKIVTVQEKYAVCQNCGNSWKL